MEKPRKKETYEHREVDGMTEVDSRYNAGWNDHDDAMSTWLEGGVPTEKEINEVIDRYMPCSCIDAYKKRNMSAPDCANCNHKEDLSEAIHSLIKRKLKGKV